MYRLATIMLSLPTDRRTDRQQSHANSRSYSVKQ